MVKTVDWTGDAADAETFHSIPLLGRNNEVLGALLVGSSRRELVLLTRRDCLDRGSRRRGRATHRIDSYMVDFPPHHAPD